jgi:hypothetical protein
MLTKVADIDPAFLDKPPDETRLNVHPNRRLIYGEQTIGRDFRLWHSFPLP